MGFKPPKGQSCANCLCYEPEPANTSTKMIGRCYASLPTREAFALCWCGHWRGNAEVRCGGCKWLGHGRCPRTVAIEPCGERGNVTEFAATTRVAFPCNRYEET